MADATLALANQYGWLLAALGLVLIGIATWRCAKLRRMNSQLQTALNNMSAGLCMWSPNGQLILCNERYAQMYNLSPAVTRPGASLRDLLEHRTRMGNFSGDIDQYIADVLGSIAKGKTVSSVREHDGRFIALSNRPMPDGGWVALHEDVTEQRQAEMNHSSMLAAESRRTEIEQAIAGFRARVESVLKSVGDGAASMETTAVRLLKSSEQTSQRAESAVRSSNEASSNVAIAATAASELSASIGEISEQLIRTTEVVRASVGEAETTNAQIAGLAEAAQKIGDVVELISDIAGQTNLLALNATIEAARAGDAGRGFAVVASEVKQLASQTAKATEDIGTQVAGMQAATNESVAAIKEIGGTIGRISEIASAIATAVEEQDSVTKDIARNVQQAAAGTSQVVSHIGEVNRGASETGAASGNLLASAQSLSGESHRLKSEVEKFLATVRSA